MSSRAPPSVHIWRQVHRVRRSCCARAAWRRSFQLSTNGLHGLALSLALMITAPALNPAALVLTFMLFFLPIAAARVVMSAVAVFAGTALVARICGSGAPIAHVLPHGALGGEAAGPAVIRFVRSCVYVAGRTIPMLVVGVVAGMAISEYVPAATFTSSSARVVIAATALIAIPIALPTFFEVPLALGLLTAGAPAGAAAALLFAGPAVNLPSLLTVARSAGWKLAGGLVVMVWIVAVTFALLVN